MRSLGRAITHLLLIILRAMTDVLKTKSVQLTIQRRKIHLLFHHHHNHLTSFPHQCLIQLSQQRMKEPMTLRALFTDLWCPTTTLTLTVSHT